MKISMWSAAIFGTVLLCNCNQQEETKVPVIAKKKIERKKPAADIIYHYEAGRQWVKDHKANPAFLRIVTAVNRADAKHTAAMDSILVPSDSVADMAWYLPFPVTADAIKEIDKIVFFSYPTQTFAAYENGEMIYTGATNMGRKKDPTPAGLFYTNWKAETTTSTFNDEWELKWNFNIENKLGVGWHQYDMPGYPASHACLRLMEEDAEWLYSWADQWKLNEKEEIILKGTPVIVFGNYDFDGVKPWTALATDPHALDISTTTITQIVTPYLSQILAEQEKRNKMTVGEGK
jgi:lipoprotein-anchoring transpeptidase ErfK/SrfK